MARKDLPTLNAAARRVVEVFPDQPVPLQDLCEAVGVLRAVLARDAKSRSKRLAGVAGRPSTVDYDAIDGLLGQGVSVAKIAEATGVSETTIRNRKRQLTPRRRSRGSRSKTE